MSTLLQVPAAALVAAEFLFGGMLLTGLFRVGRLTLAKVRKP